MTAERISASTPVDVSRTSDGQDESSPVYTLASSALESSPYIHCFFSEYHIFLLALKQATYNGCFLDSQVMRVQGLLLPTKLAASAVAELSIHTRPDVAKAIGLKGGCFLLQTQRNPSALYPPRHIRETVSRAEKASKAVKVFSIAANSKHSCHIRNDIERYGLTCTALLLPVEAAA